MEVSRARAWAKVFVFIFYNSIVGRGDLNLGHLLGKYQKMPVEL